MRGWMLCTLVFISQMLFSQVTDSLIPFEQAYKRSYRTVKLQGTPPVIDGRLDDTCWSNEGIWSQEFIQNTPVERGYATYPTRIKILFDDRNIYFALRAWDPKPEKINRFVGNRDDNSIGDLISVAFDTYHDYRAAPEFNINAGGNKTDLIVTDNLSVNLSWNAVWEGKTAFNDSSWTVEYRIPLTQLRYNHSDTGMVWGLHVRRIVRRIQETDQWSLIPRKNSGHVYSFGTLYGLQGLRKPRLVEFLPYMSGKVTGEPRISGDPYTKGTQWMGNAGIDGKFGIGNTTLDVTINPDFGQIEADPSVMNLTAFETFYDEKRPFFLEGKHIFDFTADQNMMFYSRRIGHEPSYKPRVNNITSFSEIPEFTHILNAVKLSGTTPTGVSFGLLQSTTYEEKALLSESGNETRLVAEPLTNYMVGRIQQMAGKGNTQTGLMFTSVNRFIHQPHLDFLNRNAYTAGIDLLQYLKNREYFIDFKGMFSFIQGKSTAMKALQQNPLHYFQRPDAQNYLGVDTSRRSLAGSGGYLSIGRQGYKHFIFSEKVSWWSPGFDLNDAGYLYMADLVLNQTKIAWRQTEPKGMLRNYTLSVLQMNGWNYGSRCTYNDLGFQFSSMLKNRWEISFAETYVFAELATRLLRGGPSFRLSPYWENNILFNTDKSRRVIFGLQQQSLVSTDGVTRNFLTEPSLTFRLGNHFYVKSELGYTQNTDDFMYVTQVTIGGSTQYLLARIKQQTYNFTFRINCNITPDLSIQYYGSPFVSSGRYSRFKKTLEPDSRTLDERTHTFTDPEITYDSGSDSYAVTDQGLVYSFDNPNFSFREFRSNLVMRWEYRPGSTLYLVWENHRNNNETSYTSSLGQNYNALFGTAPTNVFMIKLNFWLGI